ncbi:MAG TPA: IPT/TIG domain-containing protein [Frankiaceae bacterium]|nr:IPT/TIG domain-containing protein [Frankiaceae bacterium]
MFLTSRLRASLADRESGAVAVMVALLTLVLFGCGALVVDIGEMYSRRRAVQTTADFAALAGVTELPDEGNARVKAHYYLEKNLPQGGAMPPLAAFSDGSEDNGEITFPTKWSIRVVAPPRTVNFGLAAALGFSSARVNAAATAEVQSPASALPFYATAGSDSGYACLKDGAPGAGGPPATSALAPFGSAVRGVLMQPAQRPPTITSTAPATLTTLGGDLVTVRGTNFRNPAPVVSSVKVDGVEVSSWTIVNNTTITFTAPVHAAGQATLTVTNAHGFATFPLVYVAPPPAPAPTVTNVTPASGPELGGTTVTITGTNFDTSTAVFFGLTPAVNPTISSPTQIVATSPPGTGTVHVRVVNPGGTSPETDADLFTYLIDPCAGVNGSFGFLNVGRTKHPAPNGAGAANDLVIANTAAGIDHGWTSFPAAQMPALNTECKSGATTIPGAVPDEIPGVDGANCIDIQNGNKIPLIVEGFLDGWTKDSPTVPGRLKAPDGHDSVTLHGRGDMDGDHISKYLTVPLTTFTTALASGTPTAGWLKPEIVQCPRFAIVPILNVDENPDNGFYPITGFVGVFIDGPAPNHGLEPNNAGTQIESVRAYVFSLDFLPGVLASGSTPDTVTYLGTGPKVPVLVHDSGDPSY